MRIKAILGILAIVSGSLVGRAQGVWQDKVQEELLLMGHRNWIVIADSAYPLQTSAGIETIETGEEQLAVIDYVLKALKDSNHVRPLVHLDKELEFVPEEAAPGVDKYRRELSMRFAGIQKDRILHAALIERLNVTGRSFHVLVLKTKMTIPYTSVFLQLDCRYWSAESEARLRASMKGAH